MIAMGICFGTKSLNWIVADKIDGEVSFKSLGRLKIRETRSREELTKFLRDCGQLMMEKNPELIAIRGKNESGNMQAGSAVLKMEALLLTELRIDPTWISAQKIAKIDDVEGVPKDMQDAAKAVRCLLQ